jgi:hypothetical protein
MRLKGIFAVTLSFLFLLAPVMPASGASAAGKMITHGNAEINGIAAPAVTSVFVGDRIATDKQAITSLSFAGGDAVVMPELTKATLGQSNGHYIVNLDEGTVSVLNKTHSAIVVQAHGALIKAALNQPALYEVTLHGDALKVIAHGGVARVETANGSSEVQPGNELNATLSPNAPNSPNPPQSGVAGSSLGTGLAIGGAAAGATGLALGTVALVKVDNCKLSPSSNQVNC